MKTQLVRAVLGFLLCCAAGPAWAAPAASGLDCGLLSSFADAYFQQHVRYRAPSREIEQRAIRSFLRRFDPSRTVLIESEYEQVAASLDGILRDIRASRCTRLRAVHEIMTEHHREVEQFVKKYVGSESYEIDPSVTLTLDPAKRGHPADSLEQLELLRKLVHFQMANYVAAGTPLPEAKQKLIHRYELASQRLADYDSEDLYAAFLDSLANSLDPHSSYLSAEVLEDFRIGMTLSLEGIGVALSERDGYSVVEKIIPGGAADKLKRLKEKDKIIAVAQDGGEPVSLIDMPLRDAVGLIRGKKGTRVHLTVLREASTTERFQLSIMRDTIDLEEQAASLRFEERQIGERKLKLAVLELPSFYGDANPARRQCTDDVARLLMQVNEAGVDGLVLDVSRNGGGLLDHAVKISGFFLRSGEVVGIKGPGGNSMIMNDSDERVLYSGPMVVHTSRISASAAEILAGALKDYRRAVITGDDHTFGKGTVQTVSQLPPGQGALKITTALFFRPGGKSTQKDGVAADVLIPSPLAGAEVGEEHQDYALENEWMREFRGQAVNGNGRAQSWKPVSGVTISELARRSQQRVDKDAGFAEIRERLENGDDPSVVRLSEILERGEDEAAQAEAEAEAALAESRELTPQLEEALNVLADLIVLNS